MHGMISSRRRVRVRWLWRFPSGFGIPPGRRVLLPSDVVMPGSRYGFSDIQNKVQS